MVVPWNKVSRREFKMCRKNRTVLEMFSVADGGCTWSYVCLCVCVGVGVCMCVKERVYRTRLWWCLWCAIRFTAVRSAIDVLGPTLIAMRRLCTHCLCMPSTRTGDSIRWTGDGGHVRLHAAHIYSNCMLFGHHISLFSSSKAPWNGCECVCVCVGVEGSCGIRDCV